MEEEDNIPLETTGVGHLKRLELVPKNFGSRTEKTENMHRVKSQPGRKNPLHLDTAFDYDVESELIDKKGDITRVWMRKD